MHLIGVVLLNVATIEHRTKVLAITFTGREKIDCSS